MSIGQEVTKQSAITQNEQDTQKISTGKEAEYYDLKNQAVAKNDSTQDATKQAGKIIANTIQVTEVKKAPESTAVIKDHDGKSLPEQDKWPGILMAAEQIEKEGKQNLNKANKRTIKLAENIRTYLNAAKAETEQPKNVVLEQNQIHWEAVEEVSETPMFVDNSNAVYNSLNAKNDIVAYDKQEGASENDNSIISVKTFDSSLAVTFFLPTLQGLQNSATSAVSYAYEKVDQITGGPLTREKIAIMRDFKDSAQNIVSKPNLNPLAVLSSLKEKIDDEHNGVQQNLKYARKVNFQVDNGQAEATFEAYSSILKWMLKDEDVRANKSLNIITKYELDLADKSKLDIMLSYELLSKQVILDLYRIAFKVKLDGFLAAQSKLNHVAKVDATTRPELMDRLLETITEFDGGELYEAEQKKQALFIVYIDSLQSKTKPGSDLLGEIHTILGEYAKSIRKLDLTNKEQKTYSAKYNAA